MKPNVFLPILFFSIDRITKEFAIYNKLELVNELVLIPQILSIKYTENHGIAFGLFSNSILSTYILPFVFMLFLYVFINKNKNNFVYFSFLLILSGFLGNYYDRLFIGYVVDMIYFPLIPIFICNFADIFIFVGVILLMYYFIIKGEKTKIE